MYLSLDIQYRFNLTPIQLVIFEVNETRKFKRHALKQLKGTPNKIKTDTIT